jgi:hypothetical protein
MPELLFLCLAIALCLGLGEVARRGVLGRRMERSIAATRGTATRTARPQMRTRPRPAEGETGALSGEERRAS